MPTSPASAGKRIVKEDPSINPNALHNFHQAKRGPKGIPHTVTAREAGSNTAPSRPKDPGHEYAQTQHIQFDFFDQRTSNAPFGYEHYVSLPPAYNEPESDSAAETTTWPLILFLHGAGGSQRSRGESFLSLRHGIPKVVLCYDRLKANPSSTQNPSLSIPQASGKSKQAKQGNDKAGDPVPAKVCTLLAENFITVTPSLNIKYGYGWNASILSALLDEIVERYRVDLDRIHVTGFSMGGYGTWDLAMHTPRRFASIMPVCGGGDALRASHILHVPHWIHHGELDDVVPLEASVQMVGTLEKAGASSGVRFTRYPDLMHDSWTAAYNDPEVYRWMLGTRRRRGSVKGDEKDVPGSE